MLWEEKRCTKGKKRGTKGICHLCLSDFGAYQTSNAEVPPFSVFFSLRTMDRIQSDYADAEPTAPSECCDDHKITASERCDIELLHEATLQDLQRCRNGAVWTILLERNEALDER
jgi:hypothetical protein